MSDATTDESPGRRVKRPPTSANTEAGELVWLVGEAFRQTRRPIDQLVRDFGVTATQFGILIRLSDNPGLSAAEVARHNFISAQAAHVALTTLENKGLVTRLPKRNGSRVVGVELTRKGNRVIDRCQQAVAPVGEAFVAPLSAEERRALGALLRRCLDDPR